MEEVEKEGAHEEDKDERELAAKALRHRVDEYVALILGLGIVFLLWFLQAIGIY